MTAKVRGIRGAVTVAENNSEEILEGTLDLLKELIDKNNLIIDEIASIFFSVTSDLNKDFPAKAARKLGLNKTPLMCMTEIPVETDLKKCIRILIHYNTERTQAEMTHVYLRDAQKLRPDLPSES